MQCYQLYRSAFETKSCMYAMYAKSVFLFLGDGYGTMRNVIENPHLFK